MKKCPNGHNVGDNVKFCPTCGAEITENGERFCQSCGNERKGTEKFCSQCGTPYLKTLSSPNVQAHKQKSRRGLVIAIMACLLILVLGGVAWYFLGNTKDKYSLEELAKATVNYDAVGDFHDGLAMVTKGEKYGFIDKMGNEVVPCIYDFMEETDCSFHEGLAFVHQGDNYYFIDKEGKKAFDFKYDGVVTRFSEGLAAVWKDGKCGYIDKEGNEVIPLSDKYSGEKFSDGMLAVFKDEKYGFVNTKGELLIPHTFEAQSEMGDASEFHEGFTIVYNDGSPSCVDKSGKELSIGDYSFILDFNDGMAVVNRDNKYGFIDTSGKEVIPCAYEEATSFSEGYAFVKKDGKYMQIDKSGKILNTFNYENIREFHDGLAMVSKKSGNDILSGYIDTKGNEVIPCIYTSYSDFSEGLAAVEKDGIYGFVDKKGNSTFDLKDEEVKKIIQAKIQEKEEKRKQEEEERRIEEEKRRIEEENKPQNVFYRLAKSGDYVWSYDFHKDVGYGGREHSCIFFFYPESPTTGRLSYNELHWNDDPSSYFYGVHTAFYTVTDENIIRATLVRNQGDPRYFKENQTILLRMEKNGDEIVLKEISGYQDMTLRQKGKDRKDHAR